MVLKRYGYVALVSGAVSIFFSAAFLMTELALPFQFGSVRGQINLSLGDPSVNLAVWIIALAGFLIYPAIIRDALSSALVVCTHAVVLVLLLVTLAWPAASPLLACGNITAYLITLRTSERYLRVFRARAILLSLFSLSSLGILVELLALGVCLSDPSMGLTAYSQATGLLTAARFDFGLFYVGYEFVVWLVMLLMVSPIVLEVSVRRVRNDGCATCHAIATSRLKTLHLAFGLTAISVLTILVAYLPYSLSSYPVGIDAHWYSEKLELLGKGTSILELVATEPRAAYLLLLYAIRLGMALPIRETMLAGAIAISVTFTLGSYLVLREAGFGDRASLLGALLASVSPQILLGTLTSTYASWLAMAEMLFLFAFVLRTDNTSSKVPLAASIVLSLALMLTHAWTWIVMVLILLVCVSVSGLRERTLRFMRTSVVFKILLVSILIGVILFAAPGIYPASQEIVSLSYWFGLVENFRPLRTPAEFLRDLQIALSNYSTQGLYSNWIMLTLAVIGLFAMRRSEPNARIVLESWILVPALLIFLLGWELQWRLLFLIPYHVLASVGVIASVGTITKHMEIRAGSRADRLILKAMQWSFIILVFLLFLNNAVRSMTLIAGQVVL